MIKQNLLDNDAVESKLRLRFQDDTLFYGILESDERMMELDCCSFFETNLRDEAKYSDLFFLTYSVTAVL